MTNSSNRWLLVAAALLGLALLLPVASAHGGLGVFDPTDDTARDVSPRSGDHHQSMMDDRPTVTDGDRPGHGPAANGHHHGPWVNDTHSGEWTNGTYGPHGPMHHGQWSNDTQYHGQWNDTQYHGQWSNDTQYHGQWSNDTQYHGQWTNESHDDAWTDGTNESAWNGGHHRGPGGCR